MLSNIASTAAGVAIGSSIGEFEYIFLPDEWKRDRDEEEERMLICLM